MYAMILSELHLKDYRHYPPPPRTFVLISKRFSFRTVRKVSLVNNGTLEHINGYNDHFEEWNIYKHNLTFFQYDIVLYTDGQEPKPPTFITLVTSESHATGLLCVLAVDVGKVFFKGCTIKAV